MTSISGRSALVTGAGAGIGRALALALAAEGCPVVVADIAADRAESVAGEIAQAGGRAQAVACDVSDRASVAAMRDEAGRTLGLPTLLFANAGVTAFTPFDALSVGDVDWIVQVNLMGVFNCVEAFLPHMLEVGSGHVVATASAAGLAPSPVRHQAPYAASKAGIIALMLNLDEDFAHRGLRFTALAPGPVSSRMLECPTVRPQRFGGPGAPMNLAGNRAAAAALAFRDPAEVAHMTLAAVRGNRRLVVTDPARREGFQARYVDIVMEAFDNLAAFDAANESRGVK